MVSLSSAGQENFHRESITRTDLWRTNGREYKVKVQNII